MVGLRIFISYRHNDSQEDVYHIYEKISYFFGRSLTLIDDDSLKPGQNFLTWIEKSIQASHVVFVIIGKNWLTVTDETGNKKLTNPNDFVVVEIANALKHKKKIIPLILSGAPFPREDQLPPPIKELAYINAVKLPERSNKDKWGDAMSQVIQSIVKDFPFYKDWLFWGMTFLWPVIICMAGYYSSMLVRTIAEHYQIMLPSIVNENYYFIVTGLVWAGMYIIKSAKDYTSGKAGILLLPLAPFRDIFEGSGIFLNAFFLSFPLNVFFSWFITSIVTYFVIKFLHFDFSYTFLVTYVITSLILLNTFSSNFGEGLRSTLRYQSLYDSKTRIGSYFGNIRREGWEKRRNIYEQKKQGRKDNL